MRAFLRRSRGGWVLRYAADNEQPLAPRGSLLAAADELLATEGWHRNSEWQFARSARMWWANFEEVAS